MPDLLAHALLAYSMMRLLSWRYEWLTTPYVTAGMAGAFIPDIVKIRLLVSSTAVEAALSIPFSWNPVHRLGGAILCVLIGGVLVADSERRAVLTVLAIGATSHLAADALLLNASGRSYPIFWPLSRWHPPSPGLYLSTEPGPTIVAGLLAALVWVATNHKRVKSVVQQRL